jgi:cyanate permease
MDPITLMAAASTAFSYLKKGIEVGKELSDMEFVSLEGKMRKQRQDHEHRKQEIRNNIINWIVGLFFGTIGIGLIIFLTWFSWTNKAI